MRKILLPLLFALAVAPALAAHAQGAAARQGVDGGHR